MHVTNILVRYDSLEQRGGREGRRVGGREDDTGDVIIIVSMMWNVET
jgi:hypothetical protein